MAKVTGPLFSVSASGSIGKAIVFGLRKARNVVRAHVIPKNPMTADQGDRRIIMGGTGKAVAKIQALSDFAVMLADKANIPTQQSKQSYLVQYICKNFLTTAVTYEAELSALNGHTAKADFASAAADLGIPDFDLAYAGTDPYVKGLGLYLIAKAAIALSFTGAPYTTALASWTGTEIDAMVADFIAA